MHRLLILFPARISRWCGSVTSVLSDLFSSSQMTCLSVCLDMIRFKRLFHTHLTHERSSFLANITHEKLRHQISIHTLHYMLCLNLSDSS